MGCSCFLCPCPRCPSPAAQTPGVDELTTGVHMGQTRAANLQYFLDELDNQKHDPNLCLAQLDSAHRTARPKGRFCHSFLIHPPAASAQTARPVTACTGRPEQPGVVCTSNPFDAAAEEELDRVCTSIPYA